MDIFMWHKVLAPYALAVDELTLKFNHLKKEYQRQGQYCPIEHVIGRVKSITSILDKMQKKSVPLERFEEEIEDIAGIRIICQFVEDIEKISEVIRSRSDLEVVEIKDYVKNQKVSGYRSYHMVIRYEVNTIDGPKSLMAEIQIRTMGMDFWATVEHSLQYKYKGEIPDTGSDRLSKAANAIIALDNIMSSVRGDIVNAQMFSQLRYNLIEDSVTTIESLYHLISQREVSKIQEEFYRVYETNDMDELIKYHEQLDIIAQGFRAQVNAQGEGVKKSED